MCEQISASVLNNVAYFSLLESLFDIQNHKHIYIYTIIKYQTILYRITRDSHRLQTSQESIYK